MKHYSIAKAKDGFWKGEITTKSGAKESYNCFFNRKEAKIWCYAKVRYNFGREIANNEF